MEHLAASLIAAAALGRQAGLLLKLLHRATPLRDGLVDIAVRDPVANTYNHSLIVYVNDNDCQYQLADGGNYVDNGICKGKLTRYSTYLPKYQ